MALADHKAGLSIESFGRMIAADGRTVGRWEDGASSVPCSVETLMRLLLDHPEVRGWIEALR